MLYLGRCGRSSVLHGYACTEGMFDFVKQVMLMYLSHVLSGSHHICLFSFLFSSHYFRCLCVWMKIE